MNNVIRFHVLILASVIALSACSTLASRVGKLPPINGMIFDLDNKPVAEVIITLEGKDIAISDIQGHFSIPNLKPLTPITITAKKKNYETTSIDFTYTDAGQIIYFRMVSAEQLIMKAENAISNKNWSEAVSFLKDPNPSGAI